MLNVMGKGYISKERYDSICDWWSRCACGSSRNWTRIREIPNRVTREVNSGVTQADIDTLLEEFKKNILGTLSSKLDVFQTKHRQFEEDKVLGVFCPWCRHKHPTKECSLKVVELCVLCDKDHPKKYSPLL